MTKEEEKYTTLDTEQCKWWVNHLFNMAKEKACNNHNFDDAEEIQSAQNKIIKALDQEHCEDAVSRQAVLDELRTCFDTHSIYDENNGENYIIYEDAVDMMEKLPPVTPTRKVGKWIRKPIRNDKGGCVGAEMICTCCGKDNECDKNFKLCPNCGADMRGAEK